MLDQQDELEITISVLLKAIVNELIDIYGYIYEKRKNIETLINLKKKLRAIDKEVSEIASALNLEV